MTGPIHRSVGQQHAKLQKPANRTLAAAARRCPRRVRIGDATNLPLRPDLVAAAERGEDLCSLALCCGATYLSEASAGLLSGLTQFASLHSSFVHVYVTRQFAPHHLPMTSSENDRAARKVKRAGSCALRGATASRVQIAEAAQVIIVHAGSLRRRVERPNGLRCKSELSTRSTRRARDRLGYR